MPDQMQLTISSTAVLLKEGVAPLETLISLCDAVEIETDLHEVECRPWLLRPHPLGLVRQHSSDSTSRHHFPPAPKA
jgi:hypothetical protein